MTSVSKAAAWLDTQIGKAAYANHKQVAKLPVVSTIERKIVNSNASDFFLRHAHTAEKALLAVSGSAAAIATGGLLAGAGGALAVAGGGGVAVAASGCTLLPGNIPSEVTDLNPSLPAGYQYYTPAATELFSAAGPQISDIQQGQADDCYFLSTLGALAAKNPPAIKDMIRQNADGTISVRFYVNKGIAVANDGIGGYQEQWVTVANNVTNFGAQPPLDAATQKSITWVPIVEKAFAAFNAMHHVASGSVQNSDDYTNMACSMPATAYASLTGHPAGEVLGALALPDDQLLGLLGAANNGAIRMATSNLVNAESDVIPPAHCFTVLGTQQANGQWMVNLYNPWGMPVQITLGQFRQYFISVTVPL